MPKKKPLEEASASPPDPLTAQPAANELVGEFDLFIPITKVDAKTHQVWGWASLEQPDRQGEMMDYESSKPYFAEWSEDTRKRTGGKSLGNVRAMHTSIAAGKVIDFRADDARKGFPIGAEIVDPTEWAKTEGGVYSGFSVGGKYVKRWMDTVNGQTVMRYTARPQEVSLVDVPAVPGAVFEMVKIDGSTEQREFAKRTDNSAIPTDVLTNAPDAPAATIGESVPAESDTPVAEEVLAKAATPATPPGPMERTTGNQEIAQYPVQGGTPQTIDPAAPPPTARLEENHPARQELSTPTTGTPGVSLPARLGKFVEDAPNLHHAKAGEQKTCGNCALARYIGNESYCSKFDFVTQYDWTCAAWADPITTPGEDAHAPNQMPVAKSFTCPADGSALTDAGVGLYHCDQCSKDYQLQDTTLIAKADGKPAVDDKAKLEAEFAARGKKVGISRRDGEPLTPPKDYPTEPGEYADPANWGWPCDEKRAATAVGYYNAGKGKDKYGQGEWMTLGRRIARLASRHGTKYQFDPRKKQIERVDKQQGGNVKKGMTPEMLAAARQLTEQLRAQVESGDKDGAVSSLDQLSAAYDVADDESTPAATPQTTVPTTPTGATAAEAVKTGDATSTPTTGATVPTGATGATDSTPAGGKMSKMNGDPLAALLAPAGNNGGEPNLAKSETVVATPPPPPTQAFTFYSPTDDNAVIAEKLPAFTKTLIDGGRYAVDRALDLVKLSGDKYDRFLFDQLYHAAARKILDAGGFRESNRSDFRKGEITSREWGEIRSMGLENDFAKGVSSTTAPGYYLQLLVKLMLPVLTPLGNRFPVQKPRAGGKQAEWRVILGFSNLDVASALTTAEASTTIGSTTGSGQQINETPVLFQAPYSRYPVNDAVTVEAQYAMLGYDDPFQMSIVRSLAALMRIREHALLMNNYGAIGALGAVTATPSGSGGGLSGNSNDKFAVTGLTGVGWLANQHGNGGKGGASKVQGETAATLTTSTSLATADSVVITWPSLPNAVAYNLYYVPAGVAGNARYVGTYTVPKATLTTLPGTALANTYPTTDGTANSVGYEGLVSWCELSTIYGNSITNKTVTDQAAAALTLSGPNSIKEVDAVLANLFTNWQIAPTLMVGSPNTVLHVSNIIGSGTNPPYRIETAGNQGSIVGGLWIGGYVNKYTLGQNNMPKLIDIMSHPYLPDGTLLLASESIPYPMAREARGFLIEQQIPMTYWPLGTLTAAWPYMLFMDEVLESFIPNAQAAIQGIKVT